MRTVTAAMATALSQKIVPIAQLVKIFVPVNTPGGVGNGYTHSGNISDIVWSKSGLSCGPRNQPGVNGFSNGACVLTTVNGVPNYFYQNFILSLNTTYTKCVLAKAGSTSIIVFETINTVNLSTVFNLSTQTISGSLTSDASITNFGNGWFLCMLTWTTGASGSQAGDVIFLNAYGNAVGVTTMTIGGVQIHQGAVFQGYLETQAFALYGNLILMNTSNRLLSWAGLNFAGASGLGSISQIDDSPGDIKGLSFQMNGGPSASLSLALDGADQWQGSLIEIYTCLLDANYQVLDAALEWSGFGDTLTVEETETGSTISVTAESMAVDLLRGSVSTYSNADQQILFPGDLAFQYVASQVGVPIVWPSKDWFKQ